MPLGDGTLVSGTEQGDMVGAADVRPNDSDDGEPLSGNVGSGGRVFREGSDRLRTSQPRRGRLSLVPLSAASPPSGRSFRPSPRTEPPASPSEDANPGDTGSGLRAV